MDRVKYNDFNGNRVNGRLLMITEDVIEQQADKNDPSIIYNNRKRVGMLAIIDKTGQPALVEKNMRYVAPRLGNAIEGLDVLDGQPLHPDTLSDLALDAQSARTGASTGTTVLVEVEE